MAHLVKPGDLVAYKGELHGAEYEPLLITKINGDWATCEVWQARGLTHHNVPLSILEPSPINRFFWLARAYGYWHPVNWPDLERTLRDLWGDDA